MAVLVAYGTSHGSTRGIADRIAARLRMQGVAADARQATGEVDVALYDAVVLGSAVHGGRWLPTSSFFADANAPLLRERPTWLFSVSTLGDDESMFSPGVTKRLRAMRGETEEIARLRTAVRARDHRNFAGAIVRSDWSPVGRAVFRGMGGRYGDHRNWPAIDAWADTIAAELSAEPAAPRQDVAG